MTDQPYARPFNLNLPDGTVRYGVEFPSGLHVTAGPDGLEIAALSLSALLERYPGATIGWAVSDGGRP